jgi:hypothetical protein
MEQVEIEIEATEWDEASKVLKFLPRGNDAIANSICLRAHNGVRKWIASSDIRAVCIDGGSDSGDYEILLSESAFYIGWALAGLHGVAKIIRSEDGETKVGAYSEYTSFNALNGKYELNMNVFEAGENDVTYELSPHLLYRMTGSLAQRITDLDTALRRPLRLRTQQSNFQIEINDIDQGLVTARLDTTKVSGEASLTVPVNAVAFKSILEDAEFGEDFRLTLPHDIGKLIGFSSPGIRAVLVPLSANSQRALKNVEEVIKEVCGELTLHTDQDGDYCLSRHGHRIYGRLKTDVEETLFQVFAIVLDEIEESPELLKELNQLNSNVGYARVFAIEGQILAEVDLVGVSCDAVELSLAIKRVQEVATDVAPMLNAVFGGQVWSDPAELRWAGYRQAVVRAQVSPTWRCELNGSQPVSPWPFPGEVFVITGWNPQGLDVPGSEINAQIAAEIVRNGGHFVDGEGGTADNSYSEPSLVAWGISREVARAIGRRASQDAIFEIDADIVQILDCNTDRVEILNRRSV